MLRLTCSSSVADSATRFPFYLVVWLPTSCISSSAALRVDLRSDQFSALTLPRYTSAVSKDDCEDGSFAKSGPAQFSRRNRPTEQKDGLQIEDHEKHRDQIKSRGPADASGSLGYNAGFVRERP